MCSISQSCSTQHLGSRPMELGCRSLDYKLIGRGPKIGMHQRDVVKRPHEEDWHAMIPVGGKHQRNPAFGLGIELALGGGGVRTPICIMRPVILGTGRGDCRRNQGIFTLSTPHSTLHPRMSNTTNTENYCLPRVLIDCSQGKCIECRVCQNFKE